MVISEGKVIFGISEKPVATMLDVKLDSYVGNSKSARLAKLYNNALSNGTMAASLETFDFNPKNPKIDFVLANAVRFGVKNLSEFEGFVFSVNNFIDLDEPEAAYYLVELALAKELKGFNLWGLAAMLKTLSNVDTQIAKDEYGFLPVKEIKKFVGLNTALRAEGVVLTSHEIFACSSKWTNDEVFDIIESGLTLSEALKLYEVGFKSIQEIKDYSSAVPTSWIDRILS